MPKGGKYPKSKDKPKPNRLQIDVPETEMKVYPKSRYTTERGAWQVCARETGFKKDDIVSTSHTKTEYRFNIPVR